MIPDGARLSSGCLPLHADFFEHPKSKALIRAAGAEAMLGLISLWCWAAQHAPDGDLSSLDSASLEAIADWSGKPGHLVDTLVRLHWLDVEPHGWRLHDYAENARPRIAGSSRISFGGAA